MTTDQLKAHIKTILSGELLDGFVLIGFVAGSNEPLIVQDLKDPKDALGANSILIGLMVAGGVEVNEPKGT